MDWATFWAIFAQTHLVTLFLACPSIAVACGAVSKTFLIKYFVREFQCRRLL
jgi:hypothetical protein